MWGVTLSNTPFQTLLEVRSMFISVCKLEGFQHKFTKHEARMSPQFEQWFNALSADGKDEVTKTIYAFYFGVVTDLISLNEYTSESAFKLQQSIKDIKAHLRFLNWFKKKRTMQKQLLLTIFLTL